MLKWFANEEDTYFRQKVAPEVADYSRLFLTDVRSHEIRQSAVSLYEVLCGLAPDDARLHDEMIALLRAS